MPWMKHLADALTGSRLILSAALAVLGTVSGSGALEAGAAMVLAAWTTDALDGPLARRSGCSQTWIGRIDLPIDVLLALALLHLMRSAGMTPPFVAVAYVLGWALILWRCGGLTKPLGAAFQGPVYVWFTACLLARGMFIGRMMLVWVATYAAIAWRRLLFRDIPDFLRGVRRAAGEILSGAPTE
ncbi:MAG: hypothetical protein GX649_02075 [Chloroflexi bacterium]|nr:hypothetical protein [Chloroflexota bacterium]